MSLKVYGNVAGPTRSMFMSLEKLTQEDNFHIPGNPNLAELAQSMKCLVSKPYYLQPSLPSVSQIERPHVTVDEIAKQQKTFDKEMAELKDYDEMISQFNIAIQGVSCMGRHTLWPFNDPAQPQHVAASNSMVYSSKSGTKWSRDQASISGGLDQQLSSKWQQH